VSCDNCPDFDLCMDCFANDDHGHHPAHSFRPVSEEKVAGAPHIQAMCDAGRGAVHEAVCDGCDKVSSESTRYKLLRLTSIQTITGVRHKCLNCPDWDYCSTCYLSAEQIHPGHRFVPLYEPLTTYGPRPETHFGIYCDGPLCAVKRRKNYIRGDRYKCAVCPDTDFCGNCEATPTNDHNKTHPLIKFKSPVRHVSVTTFGENNAGEAVTQMGDHPLARATPRAKNASTETAPPAAKANAATQVQTVAEVKPAEAKVDEKDLQAWFESDTTPDGSEFAPNRLVAQSWTIRNPGPHAWPAGCAVYYVGGDDMRNLDTKRPSSTSSVDAASCSNVLEESLEPHQTAVFNVLLKSPAREGRVISYWRLKTPQGKPFGHKLWVDIAVVNKPTELPKEEVVEPKEVEPKEEVTESQDEDAQQTSQMIFPQLEKESPVSSVHDVSTTSAPTAIAEPEPTDDLLDEVDSLESDDGFMTDEEYDILDASDEDYLMAQSQMVAHK
jgi:next to BRCA1 gene 1 protein